VLPFAGLRRHTLAEHQGAVLSLAVSRDGRRAASGGDDRSVRVWDLDRGRLLHTLTGHHGAVVALGVGPDGELLSAAYGDDRIAVWDLASGLRRGSIPWHGEPVRAATFGSGYLVSSGYDSTVHLWRLDEGREVARWTADHQIAACAVAAIGGRTTVAVGEDDGAVYGLRLVQSDSCSSRSTSSGSTGG
jgi:WD40 repeat protein